MDGAARRTPPARKHRVEQYRGRVVGTAGDGLLARFDGPARAIRCAQGIAAAVRPLGVDIRAGLHTGEVELDGDRVRGIAVHIGARVASLAGPSEVLVSSTVKDLALAGSGLTFEDRRRTRTEGRPRSVAPVPGGGWMTEISDVSYARSGEVAIAYQVIGDGPTDIVFPRGSRATSLALGEAALGRHAIGLADRPAAISISAGTGCPTVSRSTDARDENGRHSRGDGRGRLGAGRAVGGLGGHADVALFAATYPERDGRAGSVDPTGQGPAPGLPLGAEGCAGARRSGRPRALG